MVERDGSYCGIITGAHWIVVLGYRNVHSTMIKKSQRFRPKSFSDEITIGYL